MPCGAHSDSTFPSDSAMAVPVTYSNDEGIQTQHEQNLRGANVDMVSCSDSVTEPGMGGPAITEPHDFENFEFGGKHILFLSGHILWCNACGSFSARVKRGGLTLECKGEPLQGKPGEAKWRALRRLRRGLHPETREQLDRASKFTLLVS